MHARMQGESGSKYFIISDINIISLLSMQNRTFAIREWNFPGKRHKHEPLKERVRSIEGKNCVLFQIFFLILLWWAETLYLSYPSVLPLSKSSWAHATDTLMTFSFTFLWKIHFLSADLHFCLIAMSFLLQPLLSSAKPSLKQLSQASCCIHFQDVFRLKVETHCTLALAQWLGAWDWILYILNNRSALLSLHTMEKEVVKKAAMLFFYAQFPIANWKCTRTPFIGWMSTNEKSGL